MGVESETLFLIYSRICFFFKCFRKALPRSSDFLSFVVQTAAVDSKSCFPSRFQCGIDAASNSMMAFNGPKCIHMVQLLPAEWGNVDGFLLGSLSGVMCSMVAWQLRCRVCSGILPATDAVNNQVPLSRLLTHYRSGCNQTPAGVWCYRRGPPYAWGDITMYT